LTLPTVWPPPTRTQQLPQRASGRPAFDQIQPVAPAQITLGSHILKTEYGELFPF
jgi:hypothetical protein